MSRLPRKFYKNNTLKVAQDLLGKFLIIKKPGLAGMICETEAYVGKNDKACHASRGMTKRNEVMFGEAGHAYVYMIYGMYYCLNIVTEKDKYPAAVLIRGIEPTDGLGKMRINRNIKDKKITNLTNGPGKLCQALGIDKEFNGRDLIGSGVWVEDRGTEITEKEIKKAKRIGIDYAGECRDYLWRFYIKDNDFVSVK